MVYTPPTTSIPNSSFSAYTTHKSPPEKAFDIFLIFFEDEEKALEKLSLLLLETLQKEETPDLDGIYCFSPTNFSDESAKKLAEFIKQSRSFLCEKAFDLLCQKTYFWAVSSGLDNLFKALLTQSIIPQLGWKGGLKSLLFAAIFEGRVSQIEALLNSLPDPRDYILSSNTPDHVLSTAFALDRADIFEILLQYIDIEDMPEYNPDRPQPIGELLELTKGCPSQGIKSLDNIRAYLEERYH